MPPRPPEEGRLTHPGRVSISTINPKEFRPVDGWPDKKPCVFYGRKLTHYQERAKGKAQLGTLCKVWYHRAVTMQSSQFRTIPGIIDITRLQKWTGASVGRCHVCDGDVMAWQDPGDHFGMCETCYSQLCESEVKA